MAVGSKLGCAASGCSYPAYSPMPEGWVCPYHDALARPVRSAMKPRYTAMIPEEVIATLHRQIDRGYTRRRKLEGELAKVRAEVAALKARLRAMTEDIPGLRDLEEGEAGCSSCAHGSKSDLSPRSTWCSYWGRCLDSDQICDSYAPKEGRP